MIIAFIEGVFSIIGMATVALCCVAALYTMFHKDEIFEVKEEEEE